VASTHLYAEGSIDHPRDTVAPAIKVGELVREAIGHAPPLRPFFDSEHGPIHFHKDKKKTLPEPFDDEYFRHIQWAHLASGGAGGGMRWPNRKPHVLTAGMRHAQKAMADFLPLIDWRTFRRRNLNEEARASGPFRVFACADDRQAVVWLLRTDTLDRTTGRLRPGAASAETILELPGLRDGVYRVTSWHTSEGRPGHAVPAEARAGRLAVSVPVDTDLAVAIRPA
jgi:mannan endo-1,4-beta-mannosidase